MAIALMWESFFAFSVKLSPEETGDKEESDDQEVAAQNTEDSDAEVLNENGDNAES